MQLRALLIPVLLALAGCASRPASNLLSFGWPAEKTVWVPKGTPCPAGMFPVRVNSNSQSMVPALHGGETAYAQRPTKENLEGYIASDGAHLHRVVVDNGRAVRLSGDANKYTQPWEPRANIEYVLRYVVRL